MSYDLGAVILPIQSRGGPETIAEVTKLADTLDKKLNPAVQAVIDRLEYYSRVQKQVSSGSQLAGSFFSPKEIELATQRMQGFESSLANTRRGMGGFGVVTQQAGYQIGDFFVQVQSGTNWLVAFGQQATQLVGILPMMGAGFLGLSTGGLIALSAGLGIAIPLVTAIGAAFLRTRDESNLFDEALTQVKDTMDGFDESSDLVNMSLDELIKKYGEAAQRVRQFGLAQAELRVSQAASALQDQIPILNDVIDRFAQVGLAGRQALQDIQEEFGTTKFGAIAIRDALLEIKRADGFAAQQQALLKFIDVLEQTNTPLSEIPPELQLAVDQMITLSNVTDEARARMEQLSGAAAGMTIGVPLYEQGQSNLLPPGATPEETGASTGTGVGSSLADKLQSDLDSLRQFLMDARETEMASYQERQDTLQQALEQKLLTQQEYNALEQELAQKHAEALASIDSKRQQQSLGMYSTLFGNLATIFEAGGKKTLGVAKAFGIAEGLLNSYRAYLAVLADPALMGRPFLRTALAASTLASGLAQVAAMRSVSYGSTSASGSGGGSGGGVGPKASASMTNTTTGTSGSAQTVYISGLDPNALFTGEQLANLFDSFYKENDNRGKVFVVAR